MAMKIYLAGNPGGDAREREGTDSLLVSSIVLFSFDQRDAGICMVGE